MLRLRTIIGLFFTTVIFHSGNAVAQSVFVNLFYPNSTPFYAPVGTTVTDTTYFFYSGASGTATFKALDTEITYSVGASKFDTSIGATEVPIFVTVRLDRIGCYNLSVGVYEDSELSNSFPITGYAFDPQKFGTFHEDQTILNFGQVPVGSDTELQAIFPIDTIGNISFIPRNIASPFSSDSVALPPANTDLCDSVALGMWFEFHPSQSGSVTDTIFIYDASNNDSSMLILKGEGIASDVRMSENSSPMVHVFPNPCDRECSLNLGNASIDRVVIMDGLGKQIKDCSTDISTPISINTVDIVDGIYFIEVFSGQTCFRSQVVVQH